MLQSIRRSLQAFHTRRWSSRLLLAAAAAYAVVATAAVAAAEVRSYGPVVAVGFSDESEGDLTHPAIGWRWQFEPGETLSRWGRNIGADWTLAIEPWVAVVTGEDEAVELQALPLMRFEPLSLANTAAVPYLEAGIGLIYTSLSGFNLGSRVHFSDNIGLGLRFGDSGWSLGYRFRHISHAGIWADENSGLNTHFVNLHYALTPPK